MPDVIRPWYLGSKRSAGSRSLGGNVFKLEFYTLSVWQDAEGLRHFVRDGDHLAAPAEFEHDMRRQSIFVQYTLFGSDLPPSWKDALARQRHKRNEVARNKTSCSK